MTKKVLCSYTMKSCSTVTIDVLYAAELTFAHGLRGVSLQNARGGYHYPQFLKFAAPFAVTTIS